MFQVSHAVLRRKYYVIDSSKSFERILFGLNLRLAIFAGAIHSPFFSPPVLLIQEAGLPTQCLAVFYIAWFSVLALYFDSLDNFTCLCRWKKKNLKVEGRLLPLRRLPVQSVFKSNALSSTREGVFLSSCIFLI